jgi:hypothetical protein
MCARAAADTATSCGRSVGSGEGRGSKREEEDERAVKAQVSVSCSSCTMHPAVSGRRQQAQHLWRMRGDGGCLLAAYEMGFVRTLRDARPFCLERRLSSRQTPSQMTDCACPERPMSQTTDCARPFSKMTNELDNWLRLSRPPNAPACPPLKPTNH